MSVADIERAIKEISQDIGRGFITTDKGAVILAVRQDTVTGLADDAQYIPLIVDANGRLHVIDANSADALTAVEAINTAIQTGGITQVQLAAMVTALQIIDNIVIGNEAQVDIVASLPAGTNNIGDVDVLTIAAGANVIGKVGIDQTTLGTTNGVVRVKGGLSNSGVKTADAAIKASAGAVYWLTVSDTAALAIEINNSTDNSGTDVWALDLPAAGYAHFIFDPPIECDTGIYLDVSTATCKVTVGYI